MAWINVLSLHHGQVAYASLLRKASTKVDSLYLLAMYGSALLALGDGEGLRLLAERTRPMYEEALSRYLAPPLIQSFMDLGSMVEYSCFFAIAGEDQSKTWQTMRSFGRSPDPWAQALLDLLGSLGEKTAPESTQRSLRYPRTGASFLRDFLRWSTAERLAVCHSPDHAHYPTWMSAFVGPLAIKRGQELACDPLIPASRGAWPDRRGEFLYGRASPRPVFGTKVVAKDPKTWVGFDVVEQKGDELIAYYYLGTPAPSVGNSAKAADTFSFLESLPHDWELVQRNVDRKKWMSIERLRRDDRCRYVVAYDPEGGEPPSASAAKRFGIDLAAKSLFDI